MTILQIPVASVIAWLLAAAFAGAGFANAIGGAAVRAGFVRWGYPAWWNFVAAVFDGLCAALMFFPGTRILGLALGAMVLMAVFATLVWHRDYKHLPPCVALAALIGVELALVLV